MRFYYFLLLLITSTSCAESKEDISSTHNSDFAIIFKDMWTDSVQFKIIYPRNVIGLKLHQYCHTGNNKEVYEGTFKGDSIAIAFFQERLMKTRSWEYVYPQKEKISFNELYNVVTPKSAEDILEMQGEMIVIHAFENTEHAVTDTFDITTFEKAVHKYDFKRISDFSKIPYGYEAFFSIGNDTLRIEFED